MRLHHLSVTAFGPFAETAQVDFDALGSAGLFLLTGATGAGKTSVLDAVCFALYGDVPGDRSIARRLRSDHAPAHVAPRVVLDVTLGGRRFTLDRSPAWQRPKKRGTGTTQQHSCVRLVEHVDGAEVVLSTRLDEVGDLVTGLVGMTMPQFCQVAMLPQGGFAAFLRARADERQAVLQRLFRTERFARAEGWLRDRRVELHRRSRRHHDDVVAGVNRVSEAAGVPAPDDWDLEALEGPATDGRVASWAVGLRESAVAARDACELAVAGAVDAEERARDELATATRTTHLLDRRDRARRTLAGLDRDGARHRARVRELDGALRAAPVAPLAHLADRTAFEASAARVRLAAARDELAGALRTARSAACLGAGHAATPDTPASSVAVAVRRRLDELAPLRGLDARCAGLAHEVAETRERLDLARRERDELGQRAAELPPQLARLRADLATSTALAGAAPAHREHLDAARRRLETRARLVGVRRELEEAEEERRQAVTRTQALTEVWLDLREQRLHGMAAEIAGALAVGGSCPVCGSCSHPSPASPAPGAPDADAERLALRRVDDAKATEHVHDARVQELRTAVEVLRAEVGDATEEALGAAVQEATTALADSEEARRRAGQTETELERLETRLLHDRERLEARAAEVARLEERRSTLARELERARTSRDDLVDGTGLDSVDAVLAHLEQLEETALRAAGCESRAVEAEDRATHARAALAQGLAEHGFDSPADVLRAHRGAAAVADLRAAVDQHRDERSRCLAVLEEPELLTLGDAEAPDLAALEGRHASARAELDDLHARLGTHRRRAARLDVLVAGLAAGLAAWGPVRDEHRTVADLAALVEGKSADNRLQMRLSAYVLAYRLAQVVAAANARLSGMSDQRYSLEHTDQRANRETRGGLGLLVRDDWSGEARDPATLSGGETFVVSLALALGLADVITEEAGGADLDTLFVDEGFGSLDADTLDDVLDTLDALRDRGRVVGVVSHVSEMRERIPAQLRVHKGRAGSTLSVTGV